jgi:carboxypeptidase Taq
MKTYQDYNQHCKKIADLQYTLAVMQWDQEVNMPPKGADTRAQQLATLSGIAHQHSSDPKFGECLALLSEDASLTGEQQKNVLLSLKDFRRQEKYSQEFVERLSRATSRGFNAWQHARSAKDFSLFQAALEEIVQIKQEEAAMQSEGGHLYNALLDEFEPGATVAMLDQLFDGVKSSLTVLLDKVKGATTPKNIIEGKKFDKDRQWPLGIEFLGQMGYDFEAGRQDIALHPFCTNFGSSDVRVTTRINEDDVFDMLSSCIHEGGHALYEQGLLPENYGLPAGSAISMGVHESQSRLWENNVGRSEAFWKANVGRLQNAFPQEFQGSSASDIFKTVNIVAPSLIRVQADELTYHFHIMIRYELEKALVTGDLKVKDLPGAWNEMYHKYLGIQVPNDAVGVLQDIHWSYGSIGYFATYSLGSFYAAQYFRQAEKEIPELAIQIEKGNLLPLKLWLNDKIHRHGRLLGAEELCKSVTGEGLHFEHFHQYLSGKLAQVYQW